METYGYEEARSWFWARTWFWVTLAAAASVGLVYAVLSYMLSALPVTTGLILAGCVGIPAALFGLFAAFISMQWPWTRLGWRYGFLLNGPACAAAAGVAAVTIALIAANWLLSGTPNQFEKPKEYEAYAAMLEFAMLALKTGVGVSVFWGFVFGSWFTLRRDRYFVEQV